MKVFTIKMEDEKHLSLKVKAAQEGKSMQDVINEAIEECLKK